MSLPTSVIPGKAGTSRIRHSCESRNLLNSLADSKRNVFKRVTFPARSRISLRDSGTTGVRNITEFGQLCLSPHPSFLGKQEPPAFVIPAKAGTSHIRHSCESRNLLNSLADSQHHLFKRVTFPARSRIPLCDTGMTGVRKITELGQPCSQRDPGYRCAIPGRRGSRKFITSG